MYEQEYSSENNDKNISNAYQSNDLNDNEMMTKSQSNDQSNQDNKDGNISVLNDIYQNSVMGKQSISSLIPKIDDDNFKQELLSTYENYEQMSSKSTSQIMQMGEKPREKNPLSKAMLWGTVNVASIVDNSSSNLANMMIKGCNNSINNITRTLNQHSDNVDENVKNLANEYIQNEQDNISNLQKFL